MKDADDGLEGLVLAALDAIEVRGLGALDELCARHPEAAPRLRRRVERLVECGLLETEAEPEEEFPERLGDFRLIEPIGGGGMGLVYRAEQISLGREVALKLVRPEQLFFPGARERFLREVEIVAGLTHPGIVPVHAVGEEDGVPFFAMELVHGATVGDLIEDLVRRGARIEELSGADLGAALARCTDRPVEGAGALFAGGWEDACMRLVREVAEALEHAHRRGVVHRDVKPSNVLVTPSGRVMLFDFGLSSSGGSDRLTRTGVAIGSIPYMSPEQVASADIDVRSDVYSLGVTLYELLSLHLPYEEESALALAERIQRGDARAIAEVNPNVPWELATIVSTAMEVDPARRYASASAFARDLDHALARRPIEARPAGWSLRARRWLQRHPARAVAATAAFLLFVVAPSLFAWREFKSGRVIAGQRDELARTNTALEGANDELARVNADLASTNTRLAGALSTAERERERAEANFEKALEAVDRMLQRVGGDVLLNIPWMGTIREELISDAIEFYEGFVVERPDDPRIALESAHALATIGELYGQLERFDDAERAVRRERALLAVADEALPGDPDVARRLAESLQAEGAGAMLTGQLGRATELLTEAIERLDELDPNDVDVRASRAIALGQLARALYATGRLEEGQAQLLAAIDDWRYLVANGDDIGQAQYGLALTLDLLCTNVRQAGRTGSRAERERAALESIAHGQESVSLLEDVLARTPDDGPALFQSARSTMNVGVAMTDLEEFGDANVLFERTCETLRRVIRDHPHIVKARAELGQALANLAGIASIEGRTDDALEILQESVEILEEVVALHPDSIDWQRMLAAGLTNRGAALADAARHAEAVPALERALDVGRGVLELAPGEPSATFLTVTSGLTLAGSLCALDRPVDGVAAARSVAEQPMSPHDDWRYAEVLARCTRSARASGDVDDWRLDDWELEARERIERALARGGTTLAKLREHPDNADLRALEAIQELIDAPR